ncbi:peptidylprolyl isomerase [Hyalangium minutum]|uniref:Peptidyl-prolyl cis-trans isomerase n=1 Tax=Hyalangium minutum TaxID=394096 RepID=A0A085WCJ6_9BACT|nr:peptidylprolyl isomerase [Hyalangium minutum]KFE65409.1 Peptidyl-prolyl cis-trans isomerase [Hyalangium minutum]
MRTRILTTGLLLLALTACTKDKEKEATPAKPPEAAAVKPPEPPAAKPPEPSAAAKPPEATPAATPPAPEAAKTAWQKAALEGKDLYATLDTSEGTIIVKLFAKDAPKTVANFVGLAAGEKEWKDPSTLQPTTKPLYDGTVFHRVIPNFMIQGGDPLGQGVGGPGYSFEDEFQGGRTFSKPGILAMANRGPNTNGSQFFITVANTEWLNNRHTIFGEVVKGYDVVEKIAKVPTAGANKPLTPVVIKKVTISDKQP